TATEEPVVVGVGASAGGLEALQSFFAELPTGVGIAVVVVTHQARDHPSVLPLLLAKRTDYAVIEVVEGTRVQADHVYVAPPAGNLRLLNGRLHTFAISDGTPRHLPINHFFRSLASDRGERAVGVVLSGTGSDGTLGLKEIKASLGLSIVQDESDARFSGMPHSAITGDHPDFVLPARDIPEMIVAFVRGMRVARASDGARGDDAREADALAQVFLLLRRRSGHDFSAYKETTVRRRIERRMNLQRCASLPEYARLVERNTVELDLLFDELLIGVTSFFRDPDAFERLAGLLTELLATKPDDHAVRVWVAGCSTGEEAYSLAILLFEIMEKRKRRLPVQIFATDLDAKAIEVARAGVYPQAIAGDVDARRLKRFFAPGDGSFQVKKEIREMLVFATQNLIEDPPFTKLDLLSCRNLLIYLDAALQRRLFPTFHYVLKPDGLLVLGSSETIGAFGNLFEAVDKKWRIYQRKEVVGGTYTAEISATVPAEPSLGEGVPVPVAPRRIDLSTAQLAEKLLVRDLVPPTVLMRERGDIVYIHGRTGMFLEPAPGSQASANIYNMAREGLHLELAVAVRQAAREGGEVLRAGVRVKSMGHAVLVDVRVKRLVEPETFRGLLRVSFERVRDDVPVPDDAQPSEARAGRVSELERELQYTKDSHQGTIEERETANEELKSTNEELQSTNEELQSANEELETSKEELQSLNEELQTVNVELQGKVEELSRANDDMTNLLNATDIATIFLDNDLNIKRYTEQAKRVIRLIRSDVGRPIGDLVSRLHYGHLVEDAQEVLRSLVFKEIEVRGEDAKWYLMRILPYRTTENRIDGLVVTFVDTTHIKLLQESEQRLTKVLQNLPISVFGLDPQLRFSWAYGHVFEREPAAVLGRDFADLLGDVHAPLVALVTEVIAQRAPRRAEVAGTQDGRAVRYDVYVEPHQTEQGNPAGATCIAIRHGEPAVGG
ncbi:MAG: CheR family methyltransferase, partial [Polyangiales bacterium]